MNNLYTIGQLAKLAGISTKTLRVYERKGLLVPERNADNSYRLYGEEAVRTLEKIQLMKYLDFSLDQIAEFLALYENVSREEMLPPMAIFFPLFTLLEDLGYLPRVAFVLNHAFQKAKACGKSIGLRINPECSTQEGHAIYDPCAPGSRLGVTRDV